MIQNVQFTGSFVKHTQCPADGLPEYAFIGRSNVGKSSLINSICKQKNLAKTSSTPGKTQLINYFSVGETFYLVDLPGYGYARVSKSQRSAWHKNTMDYLSQRKTLVAVFILLDSNIPPQKIDLQFIREMGERGVPFALVFTKLDKGKMNEVENNIKLFKKELSKEWNELPLIFKTSALRSRGTDDLIAFMVEHIPQKAQ
jgi:GTP-binding protein